MLNRLLGTKVVARSMPRRVPATCARAWPISRQARRVPRLRTASRFRNRLEAVDRVLPRIGEEVTRHGAAAYAVSCSHRPYSSIMISRILNF